MHAEAGHVWGGVSDVRWPHETPHLQTNHPGIYILSTQYQAPNLLLHKYHEDTMNTIHIDINTAVVLLIFNLLN